MSVVLTGTSLLCCLAICCTSCARAVCSRGEGRTQDAHQPSAGDQAHSCCPSLTVSRCSRSADRSARTPPASVCPVRSTVSAAASMPATISGLPSFVLRKIKRATRTRGVMVYRALSTCATALLAGVDPAPPLGQHMPRHVLLPIFRHQQRDMFATKERRTDGGCAAHVD